MKLSKYSKPFKIKAVFALVTTSIIVVAVFLQTGLMQTVLANSNKNLKEFEKEIIVEMSFMRGRVDSLEHRLEDLEAEVKKLKEQSTAKPES